MIGILKEMNYILTKKQKIKSIWVCIVMLVGASLELLGITMVLPFVQAMLEPQELRKNDIINRICNLFQANDDASIVILIGVSLIFLYIIKNIYLIWMSYYESRYATTMREELSARIMKSYMKREYTFHLNHNSSILLRGVGSDITCVYIILKALFSMVAECLTIGMIGGFLFITEPLIAFVVLGLIGVCVLWFLINFRQKIKKAGLENNLTVAEISKYSVQAFMGIKDILVMQRRDFFINHFQNAVSRNAETARKQNFVESLPGRVFESVCVGGIIGIVCLISAMGMNMSLMVPTMAMFAVAAFRIVPTAGRLSSSMNTIMFQRPSLDNTYNTLKEVNNNCEEVDKQTHISVNFQNRPHLEQGIFVKNISWKYENTDKYILKNLSLDVSKGKAIAFIGASGAGKTTLADVILGLLQPEEGNVFADHIDVFQNKKLWAQMVGYVPQAVFLTDDTVRNNIAFGIDEAEIDDTRIWKSLEQAQLLQFVKKLDKGLDTMVGERGVRFSGGQRQRIAIARALYHDPDILVLDEATSALDNETEAAVMDAIDSLQGVKTLIIVAHRLSTITNCDEIYEIRQGKAYRREKSEVIVEENS